MPVRPESAFERDLDVFEQIHLPLRGRSAAPEVAYASTAAANVASLFAALASSRSCTSAVLSRSRAAARFVARSLHIMEKGAQPGDA